MPIIGAAFTGILWYHLHADAFIGGLVWVVVGVIYMIYLTKGFKKKLSSYDESEMDDIA